LGLVSPVGRCAQYIEVGDDRLGPNAFLQVVFGNFSQGCFGGLEVTFGIKKLLAEGRQIVSGGLLDFGEFYVNESQGFGFGGDVGMLGVDRRLALLGERWID